MNLTNITCVTCYKIIPLENLFEHKFNGITYVIYNQFLVVKLMVKLKPQEAHAPPKARAAMHRFKQTTKSINKVALNGDSGVTIQQPNQV
jgi:hypothetical protein